MKKQFLAFSLGLSSLLAAAVANADERYINAGVEYYQFNSASDSLDDNYFVPVLSVALGRLYNPNFGWENKLGFGMGEVTESYQNDGYNHDFTLDLHGYFSTMLVGVWPVTEQLSLYGKGGIAGIAFTVKQEYVAFDGNSGGDSETPRVVFSPTVQVGMDYEFADKWSAGVQATYLGSFEDDHTEAELAFDLTEVAEETGQFYGVSATISRKF